MLTFIATSCINTPVHADENLFGYIKGAETLPEGTLEFDQTFTYRADKDIGEYSAWDSKSEIEYGITDRLTAATYLKMQSINTSGIAIDAYIPGAEHYYLKPSGLEAELKYNFLSPAKDDFGLAGIVSLSYDWLDKHSGLDKDQYSIETILAAQKYYLEGQMIWAGSLGMEATYAHRAPLSADRLASLPVDFDWPTHSEMEIELTAGTGITYRFIPNWFIGAEAQYQTEFETEVGTERWSLFAGPTLHYGGQDWWATVTWFQQLKGGGERYSGQTEDLHLVEKTKHELRLKFGIDF
ncbi:MAG TPA: hypothetical protein DCO68_06880 [Methylophilaceae bacterium]|nr:hypothetical protein [Methylophilaceae bacterium]HAJ71788.1 hypothetical protein [Methylophilaceae bacterium]